MTKKFFDTNQNPVGNTEPIPAQKVTPLAKRRKYSHTFSAGRTRKLVRGANGQNRWRKIPDGAIVHYGKQRVAGRVYKTDRSEK